MIIIKKYYNEQKTLKIVMIFNIKKYLKTV